MTKKKIIQIWSCDYRTHCKKVEVEAEQVLTDIFDGRFNFYVHITLCDETTDMSTYMPYTISEESGGKVTDGYTRRNAIFHARKKLLYFGLEKTAKGIEVLKKQARELQFQFHGIIS